MLIFCLALSAGISAAFAFFLFSVAFVDCVLNALSAMPQLWHDLAHIKGHHVLCEIGPRRELR